MAPAAGPGHWNDPGDFWFSLIYITIFIIFVSRHSSSWQLWLKLRSKQSSTRHLGHSRRSIPHLQRPSWHQTWNQRTFAQPRNHQNRPRPAGNSRLPRRSRFRYWSLDAKSVTKNRRELLIRCCIRVEENWRPPTCIQCDFKEFWHIWQQIRLSSQGEILTRIKSDFDFNFDLFSAQDLFNLHHKTYDFLHTDTFEERVNPTGANFYKFIPIEWDVCLM